MQVFIATKNAYKEQELSRYFKNIGMKTTLIPEARLPLLKLEHPGFILVREQTVLISKNTGKECILGKFEEAIHTSTITLHIYKENKLEKKHFKESVKGFIFPNLKTTRTDVYDWDDIFVSERTMKTYQEMKDNGIKNSARDLAFSKMIDELPHIFNFDKKINLNFNPIETEEVISFEPFIKNLFDNNQYFKLAYENEFFKNIINHILNEGLFIRRASNRKQKNYWLPGLNAGIPLTPKKDALHELTFMFHDIMHFLYPDLVVTENTKTSKHKYILSRMMSEAFTLVLADILFISILKDNNVEYDFEKRKIYPLFANSKFEINKDNLPKIKELLWANVCFALLGDDEPLKEVAGNPVVFQTYKDKYQRFFQEDFRWTNNNYKNVANMSQKNNKWLMDIEATIHLSLNNTETYCPEFDLDSTIEEQVKDIFNTMFSKLESIALNKEKYNKKLALTNAIKRYMAGQLCVFYKFETLYNPLFFSQITNILSKKSLGLKDIEDIKELYSVYIDKLVDDNYITEYESVSYKNIYPVFEPFYVFYEQQKVETFHETIQLIFK